VQVTLVSGNEQTEYYDVETGLPGSEAQRETPLGVVPTVSVLRDYKKFGSLMQATALGSRTMGIEQIVKLTSIEYNTVPANAFDRCRRSKRYRQVMRRFIALTASSCAVSLAIHAEQDWRPTALASFDTAWQTINDTYFDPAFGGLDWVAVRDELRPKVEAASSPEAVRVILRDMIGRLKQSHFVLLSSASVADSLPGEEIVPIEVRVAPVGS
jgi:hypothetical protein